MRILLLAATAAVAAAAIPVSSAAAHPIPGRGHAYGHRYAHGDQDRPAYRRSEFAAELRECRRELRRADTRREYHRERHECRRELREARWEDAGRRGYGW